MFIQYNNLNNLNFGQLQSAYDLGSQDFISDFESIDVYGLNVINDNLATGFVANGTYEIRGSGFNSSSKSTFNAITVTNPSYNLSMLGSLRYNYNNDSLSGYLSNFSYTSSNTFGLTALSLSGKLNVSSDGDIKSGTIYETSVSYNGLNISYTGNIKVGSADYFTGGKINTINFSDSSGNFLTVNGGKINATGVDRAIDMNGVYAAIATAKNLKGADTIIADDQNNTVSGFKGSDTLYGMGGNDTLDGGDGNDYIDGGAGVDVMVGGKGSDSYIVDNSSDVVVESLKTKKGGIDYVYASASFALSANVEHLTLTGSDNINGTGNSLNNAITGNAGNNILDGSAGADVLSGGAGDDTYVVDLVQIGKSAANYSLAVQDTINEASGNDTLVLRGNFNHTNATTLNLAEGIENIDASQTAETKLNLNGNSANNTITGNAANNIINAATGDDTLIGGAGNDTLSGSVGADTFKWNLTDKGSTGSISNSTDTITDFVMSDNDKLDLRDLLSGESSATIENYLDVVVSGGNTEIHISSSGGFASGAYSAGSEDARIILTSIDLFTATGTVTEAALLQNLITNNKLVVDA